MTDLHAQAEAELFAAALQGTGSVLLTLSLGVLALWLFARG